MTGRRLFRAAGRPVRFLSTLGRDERATAAVEFAIMLPFLATMMVSTVDFSMYLNTKLQLENAVAAGTDYAIANTGKVNSASDVTNLISNLQGVVQAAATVPLTSPTPTIVYKGPPQDASFYCGSATGALTATAGSTCPDGTSPGSFVQITASTRYTALLVSQFLSSGPITATATVRIQ